MLLLDIVNKNVHADVSCDTQLHLKHIFFCINHFVRFSYWHALCMSDLFFKFSNQYSIRLQSFSCEL